MNALQPEADVAAQVRLPSGAPSAGPQADAAPTWEVDVQRRFEHARRRFDLNVRFAGSARSVVLFGPSGSGKTQTLRVMAGLTSADGGHVRMAGRTLLDVAAGIDVPARGRGLGFVFQDYALFPHLTVQQNIAFGLRRGWFNPRHRVQHEAVERWMRAFDLLPVARHHPEQLSGGQRQRTALARALVGQPCALLLDEPFAALDDALRSRLRDELADLRAQLGNLPMLLITHDEADVRRFGEAVVHLHEGRVVGDGAVTAA